MKDSDSLARAVRLTQIQHFLHSHPAGLTSKELADLCGVCIRTIQRDIQSLGTDLKIPLTQNGDRYGISEGYILPPVSFSLYEAMVIFLACRCVLISLSQTVIISTEGSKGFPPFLRGASQKSAMDTNLIAGSEGMTQRQL